MEKVFRKKIQKKDIGQAIVEYLLIFAFIASIGMGMSQAFIGVLGSISGGLGYTLTDQLKSGVCKSNCYYTGYKNE